MGLECAMGHSTASLGRGTSYRSDLDCLPGSQTPEEPCTGEQRFMASLRHGIYMLYVP